MKAEETRKDDWRKPMSVEDRWRIFSKDILTGKDISKLLQVDSTTASSIISWIKRKSDRLGIRGKVMVEDYLEAFNLSHDRYLFESDCCRHEEQENGGNECSDYTNISK